MLPGLWDLGSQVRTWARAPVVGALSPNHWTNREAQTPGNINWSEVSWRSSSQYQDAALSHCLQTPVLDASGQTTNKTRTQFYPSKKMRQEKNMLQTKEQGKNLQEQINEKEKKKKLRAK